MSSDSQQGLDLNAINLYEDDASNQGMCAICYLTSRFAGSAEQPQSASNRTCTDACKGSLS